MNDTMVLLYHALESNTEPFPKDSCSDISVVVQTSNFRKQLLCLTEMGKDVISLSAMLSPFIGKNKEENVVLTFDDGHKSNYSLALPILIEFGYVATFYVVADYVDKHSSYLTSAQLRELAGYDMEIGSHGMTHRFLSDLTPKNIEMELTDSRAKLEDILGAPVVDLAIPGGHYNSLILDMAKECGYRSVATCKVGLYTTGDDFYEIPRVEIRRKLEMVDFCSTFDSSKLLQLKALEFCKALLRKSLGLNGYTKIREISHQLFDITR